MSEKKQETIFIHIAAYRDPELVPTIKNALSQAQYQNRLMFGICLQDTQENYKKFPYNNNKQFKILFVPFNQSKGCCWARSKADSLFKGEDYVMQLDSHHRFIKNWDTILINYLHKCPSKKPILSTYVNGYEPGGVNDKSITDIIPCRMICDKFENELVMFIPTFVSKNQLLDDRPQPSMFISGHFIFTIGLWKKEVPYDPNIYFTGEEHTLAVRGFTHGWDIFYPPIPIVFHMYTRKGRSKQWDDNKEWVKMDQDSKKRVHNILVHKADYGIYGLGKIRSIEDYQNISGINYKDKIISPHAKKGIPNYRAKIYRTPNSSFHTHDYKVWHEKSGNKFFRFNVISYEPHKIILHDQQRNMDLSLEELVCKWKESNKTDWKFLDYGIFIYNS